MHRTLEAACWLHVPWRLNTCFTLRLPVHRLQMHDGFKTRHPFATATQLIISSDNNNIHAAHWADHRWSAE